MNDMKYQSTMSIEDKNGMIKKQIEMYVSKIINQSEERADSIMFLLYLAAVDKTKIIFNFLKTKVAQIMMVLKKMDVRMASIRRLETVLKESKTHLLLDSDDVIEKATYHCILLKSLPCLHFILEYAQKNCINICINISTVTTLIMEYEDEIIKKIIKFLLSKNLVLSFSQKRDKRLERMSTDFKLHSSHNISGGSGFYNDSDKNSKKNIIEPQKISENNSESQSISGLSEESEVEKKADIKPFELESSIEEDSKENEGGEEGQESPKSPNFNSNKLLEFNKRISSPEKSQRSKGDSWAESSKKEDKQTVTLREITMLLTRRKMEGYLSSTDSNIFPLTKFRKNKFLDEKDFVEIAIRFCLMNDDGILNFINFLFVDEVIDLKCENIYPIKIYKLLLYYEKIALFESLYEKEKEYDKASGSNIITESFSYSIIINNITVALYLLKKYVKELYYKNESIIDSIIFILREFSESNGAVRYHHGISHLEELLYFIEIFYKGFTYGQAYELLSVLIKISKLDDSSDEFGSQYNSYTKQRIITSIRTNKLRTHFLVYNYNPLKIVTAMVIIVKKLNNRFPTLKVSEEIILENYFKFCNEVMINYKDIDQVRDLLHDKMYNGKLVIDEMADYEMYKMFYYRKPLVI